MDIELLDDVQLRAWGRRLDLPQAAVDALAAVAQVVREDEGLRSIFTDFHRQTAVEGRWHREWTPLPFDERVQAALSERSSLFYLLAYLAALPYAEREYRRRGIGMDIFQATMSDLRIWFCHEFDLSGKWTFRQFSWVWRHLSCELFRLGRLQYMLKPFDGSVSAYRSRATGEIRLLAGPEMLLRPDGYALGAGRSQSRDPFYQERDQPVEEVWSPAFESRPEGWWGHLVSPYGCVLKDPLLLPRAEWDLVLQQGDTVLDMHIPRIDPFTLEDCRDSLRQAVEFFGQQAPERPFTAGYCHTWFFTPQLQHILPLESNIVRFQREFYLYPFPGTPGFLWEYVFGEKVRSRAGAPRDTSLRRSVLEWLDGGGELFDLAGVMFHGPGEWGSQPYMTGWDQAQDSN